LSLGTSNVCPLCRQLSQLILFTLQTRCIELKTTKINIENCYTCRHNNFTKKMILLLGGNKKEFHCCKLCVEFFKGMMTVFTGLRPEDYKIISITDSSLKTGTK